MHIKALLRSDPTSQDCQQVHGKKKKKMCTYQMDIYKGFRNKNFFSLICARAGRVLAKAWRAVISMASLSKMQRKIKCMPHFS